MIAYDLSQGIDFSGHKQYYIQVAYPQPKKGLEREFRDFVKMDEL